MKTLRLTIFALLLTLAGCASMSNPFGAMRADYSDVPADALTAFAFEVEQAVARGDREFVPSTPGIQADEVILQAIRTRAARTELIDEVLTLGYAWELKRGLIEMRSTREFKKNTTRRERDRYAILIMNENNSRWAIYEGLLDANNFPPRALGAVQDAFAKARRDTMSAGQLFEGEDGAAVPK